MKRMMLKDPLNKYSGPALYQIKVTGQFDEARLNQMVDMSIAYSSEGRISTITGKVVDQSALNGLINALYNQRLTLVSIIKISD